MVTELYRLDVEDPTVASVAFDSWFYGTIVLWLLWQFSGRRVDPLRLLGRMESGYRWLPTIGILAATALFSWGSLSVLLYVVSYMSPTLAEGYLEGKLFDEARQSATPGLYVIVVILSTVVAAPVVEEVLFRGVILHRWTMKWGLGTAVLTSSLAFGLAHDLSFVGATAFGIVLCLLYIKSRSLIVPVACHALYNAFVVGLTLMVEGYEEVTGETSAAYSVDQVRDELWIGVAFLAVSLPWLVRFLYLNWPHAGSQAPYLTYGKSPTTGAPSAGRSPAT